METALHIETRFATDDARGPFIEIMEKDGLPEHVALKWFDYHGRQVEVLFRDVIALKWQMAASLLDGERDDCCYEILDSKWIALHLEQESIPSSHSYKHYRFNFAGGCNQQFECLAEGYEVIKT